jgi:hypothetical protein
LEQI